MSAPDCIWPSDSLDLRCGVAAHYAPVCVRTAAFMRVGGTLFLPLPIGVPIVCGRNRRVFCLFLPYKDAIIGICCPLVKCLRWKKDREEDLSASGKKRIEQIAALDRKIKRSRRRLHGFRDAAAENDVCPQKMMRPLARFLWGFIARQHGIRGNR